MIIKFALTKYLHTRVYGKLHSYYFHFFQLKAKFEDMRIAQNEEKKKIEAMRKQLVSF